MKKNIKSLSLSKRKISALNQTQVSGGLTPTITMTLSLLICPADNDKKLPAKPRGTSGCP